MFDQLKPKKRNQTILLLGVILAAVLFLIGCRSSTTDADNQVEKTTGTKTAILVSNTLTASNSENQDQTEGLQGTANTDEMVLSPSPFQNFTETPSFEFTQESQSASLIEATPTVPTPTNTAIPPKTNWNVRTPLPSPTPLPPYSNLRFTNFGPYSKVISPFQIEASATTGDDGMIYLNLIGEDGRTITRKALNFRNYIGKRFGIAPEVEFTIPGVAETGRLILSTYDQYNRTINLSSIDLILMNYGENEIYPPLDKTEPLIIRSPNENAIISGGVLSMTGLARLSENNPLIIELIDPSGQIVGEANVVVAAPTDKISHIPFDVLIPYVVEQKTNARLTIRQESSGSIPGTILLNSIVIYLQP